MRILFVIVFTVVVLLVVAAVAQLYFFSRTPMVDREQRYIIPDGMGFNQLAEDLEQKGYISNRWLMRAMRYVRFSHRIPIQKGQYRMDAGLLPGEFLDMVESGRGEEFSFTIIPGSTVKEILYELGQLENIRHELPRDVLIMDLMRYIPDTEFRDYHPEGLIFAETYQYHPGDSDIDILKSAHQLIKQKLAQHCAQPAGPLKNSYEALVLASIVEKESGGFEEQKKIASVFINRLKRKMRLEADPTVIYGIGDDYRGDITSAHLRTKNPYNTYRRFGLPPTPIASVWQESLDAVCHPIESDYLFFVADGKGGHVFTTNYRDHRKAVKDYIRYQESRR